MSNMYKMHLLINMYNLLEVQSLFLLYVNYSHVKWWKIVFFNSFDFPLFFFSQKIRDGSDALKGEGKKKGGGG